MVNLWTHLLLLSLPVLARQRGDPDDKSVLSRRDWDTPSVESYRSRAFHSVAVLDRHLYIVGGELSQFVNNQADEDESRAVLKTLSLPLDESWEPSTVSFRISNENENFPLVNFPALWVDSTENRLYSWGGQDPHLNDEAEDEYLWVFVPDGEGGGEWSSRNLDEDSSWVSQAGYATCGNTGLSLGGVRNKYTDSDLSGAYFYGSEGLRTFEMGGNELKEEPSKAFNAPYGVYVGGRAVCGAAVDSDPLFFPLGGFSQYPSNQGFRGMIDMRNLTFYNPKERTWHWQHTGSPPPPRANFCAVGVQSPDGTYEIFIYGGDDEDGEARNTLSDIHVLSIPAFQWFEIEPETQNTRRTYHDCASAGNSQMIVVGGQDISRWETTDKWAQGLGIFDMNSLQWKDSYDADAGAYESPGIVRDWYANGGMNNVEWNNDDVKAMFADFKLPTPEKKKTGAIVGGSIGGVAGILALCALAFWFLRRRKASANQIDTPFDTPAIKGPEKNAMELDASGYRDPPPTQELEAQRDFEASRRQELDASAYREGLVTQELDGGWAAAQAQAQVAAAGGHYNYTYGQRNNAGSLSELHAGSGVDSARRNGTMSPELPG